MIQTPIEKGTPEEALERLGLSLPQVADPVGSYLPWTKVGCVIYTSGQLPWVDGEIQYHGKMGRELSIEDGYQSFRVSALNAIAQLKSAVGELKRIKRIIRLEGSAHTAPDFTEHADALNGASDLVNDVFGDKGLHTRMVYAETSMVLNCATLVVLWAEVEE
ncbi:MAG: RidA family protein [Acidimicrobiia bacterium]